MVTKNDFSWKIAGAAGQGILSAGMIFAKACLRGGLHVYATAEYPSLIRGGHNHLDVRVNSGEIHAQNKQINALVAMNQDAVDYHTHKLTKGGVIIYDSENLEVSQDDVGRDDVKLCGVPLKKIATECGGAIMQNVVAMGATIGLLDFDLKYFNQIIEERFGKKGEKIVEGNKKAAQAGFDYVKENFGDDYGWKLEKGNVEGKIFLTGNEAIAAGAIRAGCKFYAAYPMTPASSLLHAMVKQEKNYDIVVKHTEDELAAVNMAVGASYAGLRAMTGTSGGGFCLMTEGFGLASATETPLVLVEAMRPGPGSGMATHTSQADMRFVLHASTDEAPRIVIAPGDADECFYRTIDAFNLAEKYQMPVVIMTDKYLAESYHCTDAFDLRNIKIDRGKLLTQGQASQIDDYKRYLVTEDGVSPRAIPGLKGTEHVASSYEHDEYGLEREEEPIRVAQHNKRFRKLETAKKELPEPELTGPEDADLTVISWGSTKGPILEAMKLLDFNANFLHIVFVNPLHKEKIREVMKKARTTVCIENNKAGQMAGLLREECGMDVDYKILKYDGRPFAPQDIAATLKDIATKKADSIIVVNGYQEAYPSDLDKVKVRTFNKMER